MRTTAVVRLTRAARKRFTRARRARLRLALVRDGQGRASAPLTLRR